MSAGGRYRYDELEEIGEYERVDPYDEYGEYDEEAEERSSLTPARLIFLLAVLVATAVVGYGMLIDRGRTQIPILVSGLTMLGLSLLVLAGLSVASVISSGRAGSADRAFWWALFGGVCALAAAGSLGSAIVLALIWSSS